MAIRMSKNYWTVNPPHQGTTRQSRAETLADIKLHYPAKYAQMRARNTRAQADALCDFLLKHGYEVAVNETCDLSF